MRLARTIRLVFELAAGSGVVLLLSGSAFAADAGAVTTSQTQPEATPSAMVDRPLQQAQQQQQGAVDIKKPAVAGANVAPINPAADQPQNTPVAKASAQSDMASVAGAAPQQPPLQVASEAGAGQALPILKPEPAVVGAAVEHDDAVPVAKVAVSPVVAALPVVMPMQPVITAARALMAATDLAAALPTVPTPAKAPAPAKPNGWLGQLTAELAGTVVPQTYLPVAEVMPRAVLALGLMILVLVLTPVFRFLYGAWLRRGGFARAARSDVSGLVSFFCYTIAMSYAEAAFRRHSSFLMVAEAKTNGSWFVNVWRKEVIAMRMKQFVVSLSGASLMAVAVASPALAADTVALSGTGTGSTQTAEIATDTSYKADTANVVSVVNASTQNSQTGAVVVSGNTSVGDGVGSGSAANGNTQASGVVLGSVPAGGSGQGGDDVTTPVGDGGGAGGSVASVGTTAADQPVGGRGGSVLGAATLVGASTTQILPVTGPSSPMDVSAWRAGYRAPVAAESAAKVVRRTQGITTLMIVVALALALVSGLGSAWYARRKAGGI